MQTNLVLSFCFYWCNISILAVSLFPFFYVYVSLLNIVYLGKEKRGRGPSSCNRFEWCTGDWTQDGNYKCLQIYHKSNPRVCDSSIYFTKCVKCLDNKKMLMNLFSKCVSFQSALAKEYIMPYCLSINTHSCQLTLFLHKNYICNQFSILHWW